MGREYELKYRAIPEQLEAIRAAFGEFETITMETTYYDTPAGDFGSRRWTLRRRLENGVSICTIKAELRDGARGEWEIPCSDLLQAVPALVAMGAPAEAAELAAGGIVPVCGAGFTRRAAKVRAAGSTVEIALDSGVLTGGGRELPLCEVEVELKEGTDADTAAFAAALAARYGLVPEPDSKLRRARELAGLL